MKILRVIIDGIENNEYKYLENIRKFTLKEAKNNCPEGMEVDSLHCIMTILGVPFKNIPTGRAVLEALACSIDVDYHDLVFRGNLVQFDENNNLMSSTISEKIENIEKDNFNLIHIGTYKYILKIKNARQYYEETTTKLPHQNIGNNKSNLYPKYNMYVYDILLKLLEEKNIFCWGKSIINKMPTFFKIHKMHGAIVGQAEIVKGIAKALDMHCPVIEGATADSDTNLLNKLNQAIKLIQYLDFVVLHINGADEASHRRDVEGKIDFLKKIDRIILSKLIDLKGVNVVISADHETSSKTGQHINSKVNYYTSQ